MSQRKNASVAQAPRFLPRPLRLRVSLPRSTALTASSASSRSRTIAIISRLHKGRRDEFLALIDRYFASGMERLAENKTQVEPVSGKILEVLDDKAGKDAVASLVKTWKELAPLEKAYAAYQKKNAGTTAVAKKNSTQQELRATFDPFFTQLHNCLKPCAATRKLLRKRPRKTADRATKQLTRDLLLPRLISGKLSVEDLDIQFPPSMRGEQEKLNTTR